MSKATKRKFVAKEVLDDFSLPEDNQQIVRVSLEYFSSFKIFSVLIFSNQHILHTFIYPAKVFISL